jgi:hypothetical protein
VEFLLLVGSVVCDLNKLWISYFEVSGHNVDQRLAAASRTNIELTNTILHPSPYLLRIPKICVRF